MELHQIHLFKTWKLKLVLFLGGSFIAAFISFRLTKASSKYLQSDLIVVQSLLFIMDIKISSNNPDRFSSINFLRNSSRMLSYAGHSKRKCISSSIFRKWHDLQIRSSIFSCLCRPVSIIKLWSLHLNFVSICLCLNLRFLCPETFHHNFLSAAYQFSTPHCKMLWTIDASRKNKSQLSTKWVKLTPEISHFSVLAPGLFKTLTASVRHHAYGKITKAAKHCWDFKLRPDASASWRP